MEELSYPNDVELTPECRSLLKALLCKDPKKRLGIIFILFCRVPVWNEGDIGTPVVRKAEIR